MDNDEYEDKIALNELIAIIEITDFKFKLKAPLDNYKRHLVKAAIQKLARSFVIESYVSLDNLISIMIEYYFFQDVRDTDKAKVDIFNRFILDDIYFIQKLRILRSIVDVEKKAIKFLERLNAIRNSMAHSATPHLRREYKNNIIEYEGQDIYTAQGLAKLQEDWDYAYDSLSGAYFQITNHSIDPATGSRTAQE